VGVSFLTPLLQRPAAAWQLHALSGRRVASRVEPAFDSARRRKGLLGRDEFPIDSALILAPCSSIHTLFMRFPIDVVFVASDGRVMRVFHALAPWRIGWTFRAFAAVELPAGTALRSGVRPGDKLRLEPGYRSVGEH